MVDVVNGEKNGMLLNVTNVSERNVTLINIGGSFHHPETHALVRNVCSHPHLQISCPTCFLFHQISTAKYSIQLPAGSKIQIPYSFYSEYVLICLSIDLPSLMITLVMKV